MNMSDMRNPNAITTNSIPAKTESWHSFRHTPGKTRRVCIEERRDMSINDIILCIMKSFVRILFISRLLSMRIID